MVQGGWRRRALGALLEFRIIPVLLWAYTSVALGAALAVAAGAPPDPAALLLSLSLAGLIQGWTTHAVNEIYDWRSGTDRDPSPRALSGGSKVRNRGLLDERELWTLFAVASVAVLALAVILAVGWPPWLLAFVIAGYSLGLAYTWPPLSASYRPFAGEWLCGFPGIVLAGVGAFAMQARRLPGAGDVVVLAAHGLVCMAMLVTHHLLDVEADARSRPVKRTVVVAFGPRRARSYAVGLAAGGSALFAVAAIGIHPALGFGAVAAAACAAFLARADPRDLVSVTRNELRVIQLGVAGGIASAIALAPWLWPLLPVAIVGYALHIAAASPPPRLARAWLSAPAEAR